MARRRNTATGVEPARQAAIIPSAMAGALEGAERTTRETLLWTPSMRSPDAAINPVKPLADARANDMARNDGYVQGAVSIFRDSIVGHSYRLNLQPSWRVLQQYNRAFDERWAEEYQEAVEETFNLVADSADCWLDASRRLSFTGLTRLAVASFSLTGEVLATAEWIREVDRPFATAVQIISPDRLSNPDGISDSPRLRRGVTRDARGRALSYWIRAAHPGDMTATADLWTWREVRAAKPWGRKQVVHITESMAPDQTRGVAEMVSVLKHMRMTKTFQDVMLQNAVVNGMYAASIESDLPSEAVAAMMGTGASAAEGYTQFVQTYLGGLAAYLSKANNLSIDGVKIPHLYPGTKLNMKTAGTPGGVGTDFEASLLRHIAAGLGLSYEELSHDYSKTNYSSARAAMANTQKSMNARKKFVADRFADDSFTLWLEEQFDAGWIPLPRGVTREAFYLPFAKEAFTQATWIGAGRGQIDELKETQAAILRINGGLSTYEDEIGSLGKDWRRIFRQRQREERMKRDMDLTFQSDATRSGQQDAGNTLRQSGQDQETTDE